MVDIELHPEHTRLFVWELRIEAGTILRGRTPQSEPLDLDKVPFTLVELVHPETETPWQQALLEAVQFPAGVLPN